MAFRRLEFWPTLFTAIGVLVMGTLGVWQLERLAWKEKLIAQLDAARVAEPLKTLPKTPEETATQEYFPVEIEGRFLPGKEFHMAGRYFKEQLGYQILTPFDTRQGIVLVNRGWVPAEKKELEKRPETATKPKEKVKLSGMFRRFEPPKLEVVSNQPVKNLWFYYNQPEMSADSGLDLMPVIVELTGQQDAEKLPVPTTGDIHLRNDHLGYAVTWFAMAASFIVMFIFYQRRKA